MAIKELDIASKRELQHDNNNAKLLLNREELMKQLFDKAKIIEADIEEVD